MRCARKAATMPNLRLEVQENLRQKDEHLFENGVENEVKSLKIRSPGVVWSSWATPGAKMAQDASRVASGATFLELLSLILAPRWAKKAPRWSKLEPT